MMVDDGHLTRVKLCHISLSILAVHCDQKLRRFQHIRMLDGKIQLGYHQNQIALLDRAAPSIDKMYLLSLGLQIEIHTIAAGQGIRVRIVMTLHHYGIIF